MTDVRIYSLYFGLNLTMEYKLEIPRRSLQSLCRNDSIGGMSIRQTRHPSWSFQLPQTCHPEEQGDVRIYSRYFGFCLTSRHKLEIPRRSLPSLCRQ